MATSFLKQLSMFKHFPPIRIMNFTKAMRRFSTSSVIIIIIIIIFITSFEPIYQLEANEISEKKFALAQGELFKSEGRVLLNGEEEQLKSNVFSKAEKFDNKVKPEVKLPPEVADNNKGGSATGQFARAGWRRTTGRRETKRAELVLGKKLANRRRLLKRFVSSNNANLAPRDNGNNNAQLDSESAPSNSIAIAMATANQSSASSLQEESRFSAGAELLRCRVEENLYLEFEDYKLYSCSHCYKYMPKSLFNGKFDLYKEPIDGMSGSGRRTKVWLIDYEQDRIVYSNQTDLIRPTFKDEQAYKKWLDCCDQAIRCYNDLLIDYQMDKSNLKCHATWDGLSCWPETRAGQLAEHDCPNHVYFFDFTPTCNGRVTKQCFSNGSWYIRSGHEWSDYSNCAVLTLYATRLLIGSVWHVVSAIIIGPALLVLNRLPNRGGSKRVKILSNLLFWLLVNGLLAATQKFAIIGGIFHKANPEEQLPPPSMPSNLSSARLQQQEALAYANNNNNIHNQSNLLVDQQQGGTNFQRNRRAIGLAAEPSPLELMQIRFNKAQINYDKIAQTSTTTNNFQMALERFEANTTYVFMNKSQNNNLSELLNADSSAKSLIRLKNFQRPRHHSIQTLNGAKKFKFTSKYHSIRPKPIDLNFGSDHHGGGSGNSGGSRSKRSTNAAPEPNNSSSDGGSRKKKQSAPVVLTCWIFSLGIRITRQLGYAWMFTGAVYLCSVLHFAPAEPPGFFIKWLMIVTNGFPVVIGCVYIIARTIYDRSPLTLLVQLPYFYIKGDTDYVDYLWATQLDCWLSESKYSFIEEIADFPNLVLIILNGALFVITLIIMCRINRPGSTRPEMSLSDYFKAAGTLVVLYGAHYMLIAYRVQVEGCIKDQVIYYCFLFVDGIQGIAVSYVFCYRTQEGREIINKWWSNCCRKRSFISLNHRF